MTKKCSIDYDDLIAQANGKWKGIFDRFGVDVGDGKHKPCPNCGGEDRFRYTNLNGDGGYFCNGCGPGSGFNLLQKTNPMPFYELIGKVAEILGVCEVDMKDDEKPDPSIALNKLWKSSVATTGEDPVSKYLRNRGLFLRPDCLRYVESCYESDTKTHLPAMIARVVDKSSGPITIHRTYLTMDGMKADLKSPKKLMPPKGTVAGCAVRLFPITDCVGVAEGIETAISCFQLFGIPTWSAISAYGMETFVPPAGIKKIVVFADNDASYAGQAAAYSLAKRLYTSDNIIEVLVPDIMGDFNDVLINSKKT